MGGLDFCALDFETANAFRGSPCAVGMVKVRGGVVVDAVNWLMRPPEGFDGFDAFNVQLHGITPEMVAGQPRFAARLPQIIAFAEGLPLVAHNAAFDVGVMRDACEASEPWPTLDYACSLVLSRQTYQLLSYSLPWVAEAAGSPVIHTTIRAPTRRRLRRSCSTSPAVARPRRFLSSWRSVDASWATSRGVMGRLPCHLVGHGPAAVAQSGRQSRTSVLRSRDGLHRSARFDDPCPSLGGRG